MPKRGIDILTPLSPIDGQNNKKLKGNTHIVIPQCIKNHSFRNNHIRRNVISDLVNLTCMNFVPKNLLDYLDLNRTVNPNEVENKKIYLFLFFGPVYEGHIELVNHFHDYLVHRFPLKILAVTGTRNSYNTNRCLNYASKWKFPVIEDEKGLISKTFGILDPLGGAIYPLDRIILIDSEGYTRAVISPKNLSKRTFDDSLSKSFLSDEVELQKLMDCLVECIGYLINE